MKSMQYLDIILGIFLTFIIIALPLYFMFLGINIVIHIYYENFLNLYTFFLMFIIIIFLFFTYYFFLNGNKRQEIIEIAKYLFSKEDKNFKLSADYLIRTYNFLIKAIAIFFIIFIFALLYRTTNNIIISSAILTIYFAYGLSLILFMQLCLDMTKDLIEKRDS